MSPEQAAGDLKRVGPASDVYGLGATLYCLLVGHAPFPEGELTDILDRVQRGIFPAPRSLRRTIDPALEAICLKAMALQPEDRHASALELGGEIEAWLADVRYRGEQVRALNQVKGSLCRLCIERAQNLFSRGQTNEGMLWLARALENVPADSQKLEAVVRSSLGSWHARGRLLERSLHHGGEVLAVAFSPDGRRLATACTDAVARIWDVATGRPLVPDLAHDGAVLAVAFSPDGKNVATAGADGKLRIWNALIGKPVGKPVGLDHPITAVQFSPDGSMIATACRGQIPCLWHAAKGRPVNRPAGNDSLVCSIAFNPPGQPAGGRRRGRPRSLLGYGHRKPPRRTPRSPWPGHISRFSLRRSDAAHRLPRWQGAALGSGRDDDRARVHPGRRRGVRGLRPLRRGDRHGL